jgi:hypothetical protein
MNYCTVDDLKDRLESRQGYFHQIREPVGLCPTDQEHWYAIVRLFHSRAVKLPGDWLPELLWKIRLEDKDRRMINDFLAEACESLDILFQNLMGTDVKLEEAKSGEGSIIIVDSL